MNIFLGSGVCLLIAFATTLTGCAYATREDSQSFAIKHSGKIAKESVHAFSDCMLNGLNPLAGKVLNGRTARQQIRSTLIRIDTMAAAGSIQTTSSDIHLNGDVQFLVNTNVSVALVTMSDETEVFNKCLATFQVLN